MRNHCIKNNLFDNLQFGFKPKHSTVHAISSFYNSAMEALNNKTPILAVLIDLKAAFDVIMKMHKLNFNPAIIRLSCNYLKNRHFIVNFGSENSKNHHMLSGLCQGTILAATYFIIYMNDFPKMNDLLIKIKRILYADDIIIFCSTINIEYARLKMNEYLNCIHRYFEDWKQKINIEKCESISVM